MAVKCGRLGIACSSHASCNILCRGLATTSYPSKISVRAWHNNNTLYYHWGVTCRQSTTLMAILRGCRWELVSFIIRWPSTAAHDSLVALTPVTSSLRRSSNCWWRCWDCHGNTCVTGLLQSVATLLFHCLFSFACNAFCVLPVVQLYHLDHVIRCYDNGSWTVHTGKVLVTSLRSWYWSLSDQSTISLLPWFPVIRIKLIGSNYNNINEICLSRKIIHN